jgi:hypothetical protein
MFQNINNDNNNDNNNNNNNDNANINMNSGKRKRSPSTKIEEDLAIVQFLTQRPLSELNLAKEVMKMFVQDLTLMI